MKRKVGKTSTHVFMVIFLSFLNQVELMLLIIHEYIFLFIIFLYYVACIFIICRSRLQLKPATSPKLMIDNYPVVQVELLTILFPGFFMRVK